MSWWMIVLLILIGIPVLVGLVMLEYRSQLKLREMFPEGE